MKEDILKYIRETEPDISSVESIQLKDVDDCDGFIGEHYIVKCTKEVEELYNPNMDFIDIPKTCLVDKQMFNMWLKKQNAIRFI